MTIKELISKLKEFDENKVVLVEDSYYGQLEVINIANDDYYNNEVIITTSASDIY